MKIPSSASNSTTLVSSTLLSSPITPPTIRSFHSSTATATLGATRPPNSHRTLNSPSTSNLSQSRFNSNSSWSFRASELARKDVPAVVAEESMRSSSRASSEAALRLGGNRLGRRTLPGGSIGLRSMERVLGGRRIEDRLISSSLSNEALMRGISTTSRNRSSELFNSNKASVKDFFKPSFTIGGRYSTTAATASSDQVLSQPQSSDSPSLLSLLLPPKSSNSSTSTSLSELYRPNSDDPSTVDPSITSSPPSELTLKSVPRLTPKVTFRLYRQLAKAQLTYLVVLTTMCGYALCPSILSVSSLGSIATISVPTLLSLTIGTTLCSSSANAFNQLAEVPYDAQMARTRNRPLPARNLTSLHAFSFASVTGILGISTLYYLINPLTAVLGAFNILLYAGVYTPMKRLSIVNTWVGSLVGGIPPLMGWAACTGTLFLPSDLPGWILASLLFAWQFPHFNSLSHAIRSEYARGGYRMTSVLNPDLNKRVSLRYALLCLPICFSLPLTGVVTPIYALLSTPANLALVHSAWKFWKFGGDKNAKYAFWISVVHLPAVLLLAMACKTELWEAVMAWWNGEQEEEEKKALLVVKQ